MTKGLLLLGGYGTRLTPVTQFVNKHFLPVYNKPMFYYSLSLLLNFNIKDIIISGASETLQKVQEVLQDGSSLGIHLTYIQQNQPNGIAEPLILAKNIIKNHSVCMVLGDNILYGAHINQNSYPFHTNKATIFAYHVMNPQDYGVLVVDKNNIPKAIIEKPKEFISNWAIPGIYYYPKDVISKAESLSPSNRNELEISHLNSLYLEDNRLHVHFLARSTVWYDAGTFQSLEEASQNIQNIESRQGQMIGCIEEIALRRGYISSNQLKQRIHCYPKGTYRTYLENLIHTF